MFGIAAFVLAVTATIFMTIGSGSVQSWNNPSTPPESQPEPPTEEVSELIPEDSTVKPTTSEELGTKTSNQKSSVVTITTPV